MHCVWPLLYSINFCLDYHRLFVLKEDFIVIYCLAYLWLLLFSAESVKPDLLDFWAQNCRQILSGGFMTDCVKEVWSLRHKCQSWGRACKDKMSKRFICFFSAFFKVKKSWFSQRLQKILQQKVQKFMISIEKSWNSKKRKKKKRFLSWFYVKMLRKNVILG